MSMYCLLPDLEEPVKECCGPNYIKADRFFLVEIMIIMIIMIKIIIIIIGWSHRGR